MTAKIELRGKKFGKLKVIKMLPDCKWLCECKCGNTTIATTGNLRSGHTKSCGCLRGTGIVGKRIGSLVVIKKVDNGYLVSCDCGEQEIRTYKSLTNKNNEENKKCKKCATKSITQGFKNSEKVKADYVDGTQLSMIGKKTAANKSGYVGVNWNKAHNRWQASIRYQGHKYNLGEFANIEDAINARKAKEIELFGDVVKTTESKSVMEDKK